MQMQTQYRGTALSAHSYCPSLQTLSGTWLVVFRSSAVERMPLHWRMSSESWALKRTACRSMETYCERGQGGIVTVTLRKRIKTVTCRHNPSLYVVLCSGIERFILFFIFQGCYLSRDFRKIMKKSS